MSNIDILMASYNSEKYIESQINSILSQTYNNYHIYINDDISTDNTLNILQNYKKQYNNIFSIKQNLMLIILCFLTTMMFGLIIK